MKKLLVSAFLLLKLDRKKLELVHLQKNDCCRNSTCYRKNEA